MFSRWCIGLILATAGTSFSQDQVVITPLERGQFRGDQRVGVWEYYDQPTKLSLRIDYTEGRLLFIAPDTTDFVVLENGTWVKRKLEIPSRVHGSSRTLVDHYNSNFSWPAALVDKALKEKASYEFQLTFEVHPDGIAKNPEIHNDPGFGVKDIALKAFETAPPWWIVGVLPNETPVISRFMVSFSLCPEDCKDPPGKINAKLFGHYQTRTTARPMSRGINLIDVTKGIQFSPNRQRMLIDITPVVIDGVDAAINPLIVDLDGKLIDRVQFGDARGVWWVSDNEILFKYKYSTLPDLMASKDMVTGQVKATSDSVMNGIIISPQYDKVVFTKVSEDAMYLDVWEHTFQTKENRKLVGPVYIPTTPQSWSPDGRYVLMMERTDAGNNARYLLNLEDLSRKVFPVVVGDIIGWSADSKTVYVAKVKFGDYELLGSLHAVDIASGQVADVGERMKGLYLAEFSSTANLFGLNIKNKMYTLSPEPGAEPVPIFEECRYFTWLPDGSGIVYQRTKDFQVYLWSKVTNSHKQLTFGEKPGSKKKKDTK